MPPSIPKREWCFPRSQSGVRFFPPPCFVLSVENSTGDAKAGSLNLVRTAVHRRKHDACINRTDEQLSNSEILLKSVTGVGFHALEIPVTSIQFRPGVEQINQ
jgi:hypothetical protein